MGPNELNPPLSSQKHICDAFRGRAPRTSAPWVTTSLICPCLHSTPHDWRLGHLYPLAHSCYATGPDSMVQHLYQQLHKGKHSSGTPSVPPVKKRLNDNSSNLLSKRLLTYSPLLSIKFLSRQTSIGRCFCISENSK
ncbi:hypothetical protein AVEN_92317-1 [Araneus ventricosus]|uniref:Uncharacterized protein n=1 Tax=Araneus ventricosus TaxID=182803 RepID=A0A4Y2AKL3_ARAVE|nr:hypothetical protein AVEN_92317-1 [Araneus ventricosus]